MPCNKIHSSFLKETHILFWIPIWFNSQAPYEFQIEVLVFSNYTTHKDAKEIRFYAIMPFLLYTSVTLNIK
jgi:hypothetical protein